MDNVTSRESIISFLFKNKVNRRLLFLAVASLVIEWIGFKEAYPFPDFFSDSYSYIDAAAQNLDINIWPIGYSKFLLAFHAISHSDTALVSFQFIILEIAALYFYYTVLYWFRPSKLIGLIIFIFLFFNPLSLFISNYVSSDSLFCALSLFWMTELIWIIFQPKPTLLRIALQAILILIAYTFRYNAMYYPIVSGIAFYFSGFRRWVKWAGALFVVPMLMWFWSFNRNAGYELTGTHESSILSGWQLANNALYFRGRTRVDSSIFKDAETRELDQISVGFFRWVGPQFSAQLRANPGNFFIQSRYSPLKVFMHKNYPEGTIMAWAMVSPTFGRYGAILIRHYPWSYFKYFVLMNVGNYFGPSIEKLETYNLGMVIVHPEAQKWFDYSGPRIWSVSDELPKKIFWVYPYLFLFANIFFLTWLTIWVVYRRNVSLDARVQKAFYLLVSFWIINFLFSVTANIVVLRYQFFPFYMIAVFFGLLYDQLGVIYKSELSGGRKTHTLAVN